MKYILGILCIIMWALFHFNKVPLDNLNNIFAVIFLMLANVFINMKREDK